MMTNMERVLQDTHMKRLTNLRKDIAKYEENANKCNIYDTNVLAESIGSDMDYLKYADKLTTEEQKKEIDKIEKQFADHINRLERCRCVKKIEK
jgi:hypothetical protein